MNYQQFIRELSFITGKTYQIYLVSDYYYFLTNKTPNVRGGQSFSIGKLCCNKGIISCSPLLDSCSRKPDRLSQSLPGRACPTATMHHGNNSVVIAVIMPIIH